MGQSTDKSISQYLFSLKLAQNVFQKYPQINTAQNHYNQRPICNTGRGGGIVTFAQHIFHERGGTAFRMALSAHES